MFRHDLGFGFGYWYIPRGPIIASKDFQEVMSQLINSTSNFTFLRIDLSLLPSYQLPFTIYQPSPHNIQPSTTILLDLTKSEEQLIHEMHEKTRYNIRVAERHGITVEEGTIDEFLDLLHETSARDQFRAHGDTYYRQMLDDHGDVDLKISLKISRHEGKAIAAAIICDFGKTRTYLHGASSYGHRHLMAPYALQWQLIKEAKVKGLRAYDFWGIASTDDPCEPLAGVTRFKKGWGGEIVHYAPTVDLVLKPWRYRLYRLAQRFR